MRPPSASEACNTETTFIDSGSTATSVDGGVGALPQSPITARKPSTVQPGTRCKDFMTSVPSAVASESVVRDIRGALCRGEHGGRQDAPAGGVELGQPVAEQRVEIARWRGRDRARVVPLSRGTGRKQARAPLLPQRVRIEHRHERAARAARVRPEGAGQHHELARPPGGEVPDARQVLGHLHPDLDRLSAQLRGGGPGERREQVRPRRVRVFERRCRGRPGPAEGRSGAGQAIAAHAHASAQAASVAGHAPRASTAACYLASTVAPSTARPEVRQGPALAECPRSARITLEVKVEESQRGRAREGLHVGPGGRRRDELALLRRRSEVEMTGVVHPHEPMPAFVLGPCREGLQAPDRWNGLPAGGPGFRRCPEAAWRASESSPPRRRLRPRPRGRAPRHRTLADRAGPAPGCRLRPEKGLSHFKAGRMPPTTIVV
jgi:hypothetical protein